MFIICERIFKNGIQGVLFKRCLLQTVQTQFASIAFEDTMEVTSFKPASHSHPLNSDTGVMGVIKIEKSVKHCERQSVSWTELKSDSVQSFVYLYQLYSDRPTTSIKRNGSCFYSLHPFVLNLTESLRNDENFDGKNYNCLYSETVS